MQKPQNRGRGRRTGLLVAGIALAVVVGILLTLRVVKGPDFLSKVFASESKPADEHAGKVAVLVSPVVLEAFTAIDPNAFIDPQTGDYHVRWVSESVATSSNLIRDPNLLRGRVLSRDKQPWRGFSEADLYPIGTRPGPTAALSPGQRGVTLKADQIEGLEVLKRFDRFDLFAVKSSNADTTRVPAGTYVDPEITRAQEAEKGWASNRMTITTDAVALVPMPPAGPGRGANRTVFAGMKIDEANALAIALEKGAKIYCQPRTGLPSGDSTPLPEAQPQPEVTPISVTNGTRTTTKIVPDGDEIAVPTEDASTPNAPKSSAAPAPAPKGASTSSATSGATPH